MSLNFNSLIENIPNGRLVNLIGDEVCDALSKYTQEFDTGNLDLRNSLYSRYGESLLLDRQVYATIFDWLDPEKASIICNELGINYSDSSEAISKLRHLNLKAKPQEFIEAFALACGLNPNAYSKITENKLEPVSSIEPKAPLHDYQKRIKDAIVTLILSTESNASALVHMPTGSGKTRTCIEALIDFQRAKSALGGHDNSGYIVWLAHSKELCEQACETFEFLWNLRGDSALPIYRIYGDHDYPTDLQAEENAVIFASFQKFNAMRKSSGVLQKRLSSRIPTKTRLVVVDEAHKSLATTYEDAIRCLTSTPGKRLIGLTATPGRSVDLNDPQNNYLSCFYQGTKIDLTDNNGVPIDKPIDYLQGREILANIERHELQTHCEINISSESDLRALKESGDDYMSSASATLASNPIRNHILINAIVDAYENEKSVLVFACSIDHCIIIETLLAARGIKSQSVLSTTHKTTRQKTIDQFKDGELKILINYGVLSTGFDAPCLDTLIIARPISSIILYSQIIGRALRGPLNGGNAVNTVIDLIDNIKIMGTVSKQFSHFDTIWKH